MASSVIKKGTSIKFESDWFVVGASSWYTFTLPHGMYIEKLDSIRYECQQPGARHTENIVPNFLGNSSIVEIYNMEAVDIAIRFYIIN